MISDKVSHSHQGQGSPSEYEVTLSNGHRFLLAETAEDAAWAAVELSLKENSKLINVRRSN